MNICLQPLTFLCPKRIVWSSDNPPEITVNARIPVHVCASVALQKFYSFFFSDTFICEETVWLWGYIIQFRGKDIYILHKISDEIHKISGEELFYYSGKIFPPPILNSTLDSYTTLIFFRKKIIQFSFLGT